MATLTINTTAPHAAILADAVGDAMGLTVPGSNTPRAATAAEVKQFTVDYLTNLAQSYQRKKRDAALVEPTPITPT